MPRDQSPDVALLRAANRCRQGRVAVPSSTCEHSLVLRCTILHRVWPPPSVASCLLRACRISADGTGDLPATLQVCPLESDENPPRRVHLYATAALAGP